MKKLFGAALIAALTMSANIAHAAVKSVFTEDGSTLCNVITDVDPDADACFGFSIGSAQSLDYNTATFGSDTGLFGYSDWVEVQKEEEYTTAVGEYTTNTITIVANTYTMIAIFLKSSNEFAAYLFGDGLSGDFTFTMGNGHALSDYLVVGRVPAVPLPAGGFLLLGGIGAFGLMRRRQKTA